MKNTKDVTVENSAMNVLAVGDYGSGKSTLFSSFPQPGFIFDFDNQIPVYRDGDWDYGQYPVSPKGWAEFEKGFRVVKDACKEGKYKTVIFDSATGMTALAMERAMSLDPKRSPTGGPLWNVHYQMVKNLMEGKLRQFLNFNCNLVFIAHMNTKVDENGAVIGVEPSLTGQLSADVPSYFKHNAQFTYTAPTNTKISVGVNNVFDKKAPSWYDGFRDYRDSSWSLYDQTGRSMYLRLEQKF